MGVPATMKGSDSKLSPGRMTFITLTNFLITSFPVTSSSVASPLKTVIFSMLVLEHSVIYMFENEHQKDSHTATSASIRLLYIFHLTLFLSAPHSRALTSWGWTVAQLSRVRRELCFSFIRRCRVALRKLNLFYTGMANDVPQSSLLWGNSDLTIRVNCSQTREIYFFVKAFYVSYLNPGQWTINMKPKGTDGQFIS